MPGDEASVTLGAAGWPIGLTGARRGLRVRAGVCLEVFLEAANLLVLVAGGHEVEPIEVQA